MEKLEELPRYGEDERWLVRDDGQVRVAWHIRGMEGWLSATYSATRGLTGVIHPRLSVLHSLTLDSQPNSPRLVAVVEDDRGPTMLEAAEQLAGIERERWAIAQVIAIAEGLAAARACVHRSRGRRIHRQRARVRAWSC